MPQCTRWNQNIACGVISFLPCGSWCESQVTGLGNEHSYPLSHLSGTERVCFFKKELIELKGRYYCVPQSDITGIFTEEEIWGERIWRVRTPWRDSVMGRVPMWGWRRRLEQCVCKPQTSSQAQKPGVSTEGTPPQSPEELFCWHCVFGCLVGQ